MLSMCKPIFVSGKTIVLYISSCVTKCITDLESKGMHTGALIKKRCYFPKGVHGDLIDAHFEDKEAGDVGMLESRTQDNKLLRILCMKYPYYVMNIMTSWVALDEL